MARRRFGAYALVIGAVGVAAVLWRYPTAAFYPACPIYALLGVRCPGCGATRAMAALLHGDWRQALRWNALFVGALPWLLGYAWVAFRRAVAEAEFCWPRLAPGVTFGCLAVTVGFAFGREILGF